MSPLPAWAHELVLAPAVLALTLAHARRALGLRRALLEVGALVAYGYALEWVAMGVFRSHDYGRAWRVAPGGVPLAVAAVWASVILASAALAARRGRAAGAGHALSATAVAISLDLLMEPVAVRLGLWRWTPPGGWLGVPLGNFVGWTVIVASWCVGLGREPPDAPIARVAARRALLAAGAIALLVIVGAAWRGLGAERAFGAAAGWALAAGVWLLALLAVAHTRTAAPIADTVAGRLGGTPGRAPEAAILALAAAFGFDALALGDVPLRVVAGAALAVIGWVIVASVRYRC